MGSLKLVCGNVKEGEKYIGEASRLKTENDDVFELALMHVQIESNIIKNNINYVYNNYQNVINKTISIKRVFNQRWLIKIIFEFFEE